MASGTDQHAAPAGVAHLMSIDVEEYFQVEAAHAAGIMPCQWAAFETRLDPCIERILSLLDEHDAGATFFVLGWVAEHHRDLVRRIADAGHELATHGMSHAMLGRLSPETFRRELRDSRHRLEEIASTPVRGYRAPTFSVTRRTGWAIDVLAEEGFQYDSSVFPVRHDRYGVPEAPTGPHWARGPAGGRLLEIPPLTLRVLGRNLPIAGGGYLRLFPVSLIGHGLKRCQSRHLPGMIYLHPWELDAGQPMLPMRPLQRWRHRVGLRRTEAKLHWLLDRFRFCSVSACLESLQAVARQTTFAYTENT